LGDVFFTSKFNILCSIFNILFSSASLPAFLCIISGMPKKSSDKKSDKKSRSPRVSNRRARFDYEILEKVECGLELLGTEVKSLRSANASLEGAFARIRGSEVYLCGANIVEYKQAVGALDRQQKRDIAREMRKR
jgi:SsrA-binding protein